MEADVYRYAAPASLPNPPKIGRNRYTQKKRKGNDHRNKRQDVAKAYAMRDGNKKNQNGDAPKCGRCYKNHHRRCDVMRKRAYEDAEKIYNEMLEEVEARREYRHGIILELMKLESDYVLDECLAVLRAAEQEDFAEISRLIQMSHGAVLRAGEKGRMVNKLRKLK
ncbi:hypothetical protein CTI12_AA323570 [Artemisia annua]|uniref:Uncharacterized protein n=2 Tax=Artemisia annua TaxID=35608 RepID=A0A2U1N0A9_ARTAN|nr:hypothetical protein CTI12_AA323570 [Artemisia annua]